MINFRYHIVSLTAVFLSLIIGILMGTTVVSRATVDGLKSNLSRAEARSAAVHRTNNELSKRLSTRSNIDDKIDGALGDATLANAVDGALAHTPVLILSAGRVDKDLLNRTVTALTASGAKVDGMLILDDAMALSDADTKRVRDLLHLSPRANVQSTMVRRVAIALAEASLPGVTLPGGTTTSVPSTTAAPANEPSASTQVPDGQNQDNGSTVPQADTSPTTTLPVPEQPEVIGALRSAGLLDFRSLDGRSGDSPVLADPERANGTGYRYVILGGEDPENPGVQVLLSLISALVALGPVPQVIADGPGDREEPATSPFLEAVLRRDGVKGHVSTVDDAGTFAGDVAIVYALAGAARGHFDSYGIGPEASAVMPVWTRGG